ncbi:MAG: hypothetical protein A2W22_02400 [Candidatus Levybacteria bacterium RBG_16_35_11]|nr:MAG: hypothetical protein A2W22_02400 [Candidatus Levybacteria bacterium RBG_16_35_11]
MDDKIGVIIMGYRKYSWASSKISDDDMAKMYRIKKKTKKPITEMVAEAIKEYLARSDNISER